MSEQELMLQNAQSLMHLGEYEKGIKLLRELGDYPLALRFLGNAYNNGTGVEKDRFKALEYYIAAFEHGERDLGFYEDIHELVSDNLRDFKKNKCDFKEEIMPIYNLLKLNIEDICKETMPYNDVAQFNISALFITAFKNCCDIVRVFLAHQGVNCDLPPRLLFLEGMKLGLAELEFLKDVITCHDKITVEGEFSILNEFGFTLSIMAMRTFMERVDEVINNKSDAEILKEILDNNTNNNK